MKQTVRIRRSAAVVLLVHALWMPGSSSYVPVKVLTKSRPSLSRPAATRIRAWRRLEKGERIFEGDGLIRFAMDVEKQQAHNESVSDAAYFSKPLHPIEQDDGPISHYIPATKGYEQAGIVNGNKANGKPHKRALDDNDSRPLSPDVRSNTSEKGGPFRMPRLSTDELSNGFVKARSAFFKPSFEEQMDGPELIEEAANNKAQQLIGIDFSELFSPITSVYTAATERVWGLRNSTRDEQSPDDNLAEGPPESVPQDMLSMRRLWRRRHARTLEEGIRREQAAELSDLLNKAQIDAGRPEGKRFIERMLMGLLNALAEEIEDLDIEFDTRSRTPIWRKKVQQVRINFSRLGFKPIRMGGSDKYDRNGNAVMTSMIPEEDDTELSLVESADEAFDRIDKDNSGTLDREEIAEALSMISELETDKDSIEKLAADLLDLYDINSDGVVDREEYQQMVEDMAKHRPASDGEESNDQSGPLKKVKASVQSISRGISKKAAQVAAVAKRTVTAEVDPNEREMGSIILSDLNLDLRRLVFGGIPIIKRIAPGGPLILEPLTATLRGSFTREDVMGSFLLDSGLRLLVSRVIRLRVRSFRDVVDGAYFFGRQWKMASKTAPVVQVLGLSNVEFVNDKMILTGRARIRTSPDAPIVTNTFKVRTKVGTGNNGQSIGLREPELAFVFECPQAWENGLGIVCEQLGMPPPKRPKPLYSFFPIYSPFKVNENAGFDMGEDNQLKKIFIKDGKLRFEMCSVLRPGRFLGNHYLAFTIPNRTFIITMDRVREGIRVARKNKKIATREKRLISNAGLVAKRDISGRRVLKSLRARVSRRRFLPSLRLKAKQPKPRSFFTRFVEGYTLLEREGEAKNERLTMEISDWFGRQGSTANSTDESDMGDELMEKDENQTAL